MTISILVGDVRGTSGRFLPGVHAWRKPQKHWERGWLEEQYVRMQRSAAEIASDCDCTENNILFWLKKHGIERRDLSGARAVKHWGSSGEANPMFGKTGASNPNYIDGSSPERQRQYASSEGRSFLRQVYARDQYRCVRCGAGKTGPRSLHAHHIKPWAGNPGLRFDLGNAVTLCRYCHHWVHSKANSDMEYLA